MVEPLHRFSPESWRSLTHTFGRRAVHGKAAAEATGITPAPSAMLCAEATAEVALALRAARAERLPVVVAAGRTRSGARAGAGIPADGYLLLDLRPLAGIEEVQAESLWLRARAGTTLAAVFEAAARHGCRPVGLDPADPGTVGGWLASGAWVPDPILGIPQPPVLSLEAVLPTGNPVHSVTAPRCACGPDLFSLFLGTLGVFGVITRATLKLEPLPEKGVQVGYVFQGAAPAWNLVRQTVVKLLPPVRALVVVGPGGSGAWVSMVFEGSTPVVEGALRLVAAEAERSGGKPEEPARVRTWTTPSSPDLFPVLEAAVRWSVLGEVLAAIAADGCAEVVLDRPELTGCRLRGFKVAGTWLAGVQRILDPGDRELAVVHAALDRLGQLRRELDPDTLLNPQSWPPRWLGGSA